MATKHNVYFDGKVQSLGFTDDLGNDWTVGVIEPGEYKFDASRYEEVEVLHGSLRDHRTDQVHHATGNFGLPRFAPGETVHLSCEIVVVYRCRYRDTVEE